MRFFIGVVVFFIACGRGGNDCKIAPDGKSDCAQGYFCDGTGHEVLQGNTYYVLGKCQRLRQLGERCYADAWCAQPTHCVPDQPPNPNDAVMRSQPGSCR